MLKNSLEGARTPYLLVLALILLGANPAIPQIVRGIGIILFSIIIHHIYRNHKTFEHNNWPLLIVLICILPLTIIDLVKSLTEGFVTYSFVLIPVGALAGWMAVRSIGSHQFATQYERVVFHLGILSLPGFVLFCVNPEIARLFIPYQVDVFGVILENRTTILQNFQFNPWPVFRNAGFASEPGFFAVYLNIALSIHVQSGRISLVRTGLYILLIFTTVSTAGFVVLAINLLLSFRVRYLPVAAVALAIASPILIPLAEEHVESRITSGVAYESRGAQSELAIQLFLDNPLGIGAYEYERIYRKDTTVGSYDAYTQMALRYGFLGLFGLIFGIVLLMLRNLALGAVIFVSLFTSPIWFIPAIFAIFSLDFVKQASQRQGHSAERRAFA